MRSVAQVLSSSRSKGQSLIRIGFVPLWKRVVLAASEDPAACFRKPTLRRTRRWPLPRRPRVSLAAIVETPSRPRPFLVTTPVPFPAWSRPLTWSRDSRTPGDLSSIPLPRPLITTRRHSPNRNAFKNAILLTAFPVTFLYLVWSADGDLRDKFLISCPLLFLLGLCGRQFGHPWERGQGILSRD